MEKNTEYLGRIANEPIESLDMVKWEGGAILVHFNCTEFSSHCPVTGQPDFGKLEISYIPDGQIVETKSLKLYLWKFRHEKRFNEGIVDKIAAELFEQAKPKWCQVIGKFNQRGGIAVTATAERGEK